MKIIHTHEMEPDDLPPFDREMVYNGLDCCVTNEVFEAIHPQLDNHTAATYAFSRDLQAPTLEMRCRGVLVDQAKKNEVIDDFFEKIDQLEGQLEEIVLDGVGLPTFNWRSPKDLQHLFYDVLGLPKVRKQGRVTTDRAARERLEVYPIAEQICKHLNGMADLAKKISVLKTEIDPDGRIRTSYNIAGTSTGRFSSSFSEFGTGGNLQNVEESLRSILISDPGTKFAKCDAKSGESFVVGALEWNLFGDGTYLDACESGDPHTAVARICWPDLPWTGDLKRDKAIAESPYYRHYTYRFMCKKLGHGSNYNGQAETLSQQSKLPYNVVAQFQPKYFAAFPAHRRWQQWVADTLADFGYLVSLTGRKRWFFGRRSDPKTLREAIAYDPQCSLADIVNRALLRLWRMGFTIVMHDHDALTFMYKEEEEDEIIPALLDALVESIPLENGRVLRIPYDCKVGWNKGEWNEQTNPDGLKDYHGHDERKRSPQVSILDRVIHRRNIKPRQPSDLQKMVSNLGDSSSLGAEGVGAD